MVTDTFGAVVCFPGNNLTVLLTAWPTSPSLSEEGSYQNSGSNSWYGDSREFPEEHLLVFRVSEVLCLIRKKELNEDIPCVTQQKATVLSCHSPQPLTTGLVTIGGAS